MGKSVTEELHDLITGFPWKLRFIENRYKDPHFVAVVVRDNLRSSPKNINYFGSFYGPAKVFRLSNNRALSCYNAPLPNNFIQNTLDINECYLAIEYDENASARCISFGTVEILKRYANQAQEIEEWLNL